MIRGDEMDFVSFWGHWILAIAHERYCRAYWRQVEENERYIQLLQSFVREQKKR